MSLTRNRRDHARGAWIALSSILAPFAAAQVTTLTSTDLAAIDVVHPGAPLCPVTVYEKNSGVDLNQDGDVNDFILVVIDTIDGTVWNSGLTASPGPVSDGRYVGFLRSESGQNDWNNDGDQIDRVAHVVDTWTGSLHNTGFAARFPPEGKTDLDVEAGVLTLLASESADGVDHNADGDMADHVLVLFDPAAAATVVTALAVDHPGVRYGEWHVFDVRESSQGVDLNGDGDATDVVPHRIHVGSHQIVNTGSAGKVLLVRDDRVFLAVDEDKHGVDLSGDGDFLDDVLIEEHQGVVTNHALAIHPLFHPFDDERLLVASPEEFQGQDLNNDGDMIDRVVHVVDPATGQIAITPATVDFSFPDGNPVVRDGVVVSWASELSLGSNVNLDFDNNDLAVLVTDVVSGTSWVPPFAVDIAVGFAVVDDGVLFGVSEAAQGQQDLDGDGVVNDLVLHRLDLTTGQTQAIPLSLDATGQLVGNDHMVLFEVSETASNQVLNGDGDKSDPVMFVYDVATGRGREISDSRSTRRDRG